MCYLLVIVVFHFFIFLLSSIVHDFGFLIFLVNDAAASSPFECVCVCVFIVSECVCVCV